MPEIGVDIPVLCQHCEDPPCMVCPVDAMSIDEKGIVVIDGEKCTGCGECVKACPYGAISIDKDKGIAFKCDLCGGDPACVKICQAAYPPGKICEGPILSLEENRENEIEWVKKLKEEFKEEILREKKMSASERKNLWIEMIKEKLLKRMKGKTLGI